MLCLNITFFLFLVYIKENGKDAHKEHEELKILFINNF